MYGLFVRLPKIKTARRPCAEGVTYLLQTGRSRSHLERNANGRNARREDRGSVYFVQEVGPGPEVNR